jgi:hypothetical protein
MYLNIDSIYAEIINKFQSRIMLILKTGILKIILNNKSFKHQKL